MRQDHEPTAKDCEDALATMEKLKRLAEEDPILFFGQAVALDNSKTAWMATLSAHSLLCTI